MKQIATYLITVIILFSVSNSHAQSSRIYHTEPPFWWINMNTPMLEILIHGEDVGNCNPVLNNEGVSIINVGRTDNKNYLFVKLLIDSQCEAGIIRIDLTKEGKLYESIDYELKARKKGSAARKGFSREDVIYLLMPDRFANAIEDNDNAEGMLEKADRSNPNGRHGGDIAGINTHLDYIKNMGFTALWINPLMENNNQEFSYHGYAVSDFYNTDPRYGSNEDYLKLVNNCHEKGLKVILDMIFNHASTNHWFIKDLPSEDWIHQFPEYTRSNFRSSTITDPYASDADKQKMLTGWFDKQMADLNQNNTYLKNYLIQNTIWWIEYADIDGIRLDTQPYSYKEMVAEWGKRIHQEYPNFNIVGESWLQKIPITAYFQKDAPNRDGYNSYLPSVTDFPLCFAMNKAFVENDGWTTGLSQLYYVLAQDFLYADPFMNLIFLDNHDLSRFFSNIDKDLQAYKMGLAFLLTTRGIPMIYYGTEILSTGIEHHGHGEIRKDFPGGWKTDKRNAFTAEGRSNKENEAFSFLQKLLQWRNDKMAIHYGSFKHFIPENHVYVYFRNHEDETIMVCLNNSKETQSLNMERFVECTRNYNSATDIFSGNEYMLNTNIMVPARSALILELHP